MNDQQFARKELWIAMGVGAGLAASLPLPVLAADVRVDVTGSNIKRVEGEGALPVQILTREDIERTGATTVYDLLTTISANSSLGGTAPANLSGNTTYGTSNASLRGLGPSRTLILVNGKRLANLAGDGIAVDLNAVPFPAVERVEILKDGASAIYGADAVAGVINFILRQDFTGVQATAYYGNSTRSGGSPSTTQGTATLGWGDITKDRFNVFGMINWQQSKALDAINRNFSNSSVNTSTGLESTSGNTFPANVGTPAHDLPGAILPATGNPKYPNCAPSISNDPNFGPGQCRYDPARTDLQNLPKQTNTAGYVAGTYRFANDWEAYMTGTYTKTETNSNIQPVPLSDQFSIPFRNPIAAQYGGWSQILIPASSPYYPHDFAVQNGVDGQPLNVRYRAVDNGPRNLTDTNDQWQIVAGTRGSLGGWEMDGWFNYNESTTHEHLNNGFPLYTLIMPLLNSGRVNVFGPNTPEILREIQATNYVGDTFSNTLKQYGVTVKASNEIYKLPAGGLAVAVGGSWGKEEWNQQTAAALATGDVTGYGGDFQPVSASRDAYAFWAEANVPIVKGLEANFAARYDHYSDFGSTTNPKVSVRWQPVKEILMRASWGTGFRAPSLPQLFTPLQNSVSVNGVDDPLRCPTTGSSTDCATQFTTAIKGTPNLQPEKSDQVNVGIVFEPAPGFSIGVDAFKINLKSQVQQGVNTAYILQDANTIAQYGYLVHRGAVEPSNPTLPGPITFIDQPWLNLGNIKISGADLDLRARLPATPVGLFTFALQGTYYWQYDAQQPSGDYVGVINNANNGVTIAGLGSGYIPRWKQYASLAWESGPWAASIANTFQTSYIDYNTDNDGNLRRVGSMSLWDLQGSYKGFKNWNLTLGVKNLFDTDPPATNQAQTFQGGYDPSYYDPRGRFVYGVVTYAFK